MAAYRSQKGGGGKMLMDINRNYRDAGQGRNPMPVSATSSAFALLQRVTCKPNLIMSCSEVMLEIYLAIPDLCWQ
jgi:hypothetical protein